MKKTYQSPALETIDMELADILESTTITISEDTTTTVDSRDFLIFTLMDE